MLIGALAGAWAGYRGGWVDEAIMRIADFVLVLPVIYVVLVLRAVLPLVLPATTVFLLVSAIFILVGWPFVAKGVRAIVAVERNREYVQAAQSLGAGHARIVIRHLIPGVRGSPAGAGHAAAAGVHPRRSHAVVHRPRLSGSDCELGHDARRCGKLQRYLEISVDALTCDRNFCDRPRDQPDRLLNATPNPIDSR